MNTLVMALESHKPGLLRFLTRRLGCEETAHDVYQGLSERLISDPVKTLIKNPKAYLYRAAANAAHSHQRADTTRSIYEQAAAAQAMETDALDPERALLANDALAVVELALSELPILTQRMFLAFRVDGETQRDIAKRYGVSLSTVEKRIAKAAAHCHRRLELAGVTATADEPRRTTRHRQCLAEEV